MSWKESSRTCEHSPHSLPHMIKSTSVRSTVLGEMQALWSQPHHTSRGTASAGGGAAQHPPSWFLSGSLPTGVPQVGRCMRASAQPKADFPQRHQVASTSHLPDVTSAPRLLPRGSCGRNFSQVLKKWFLCHLCWWVGLDGDLGSPGGQDRHGEARSTRSCIRSSSRHRSSHPRPSPAAPGARSLATAGPQLPLTLIPSLVQSTAPQRGPRL